MILTILTSIFYAFVVFCMSEEIKFLFNPARGMILSREFRALEAKGWEWEDAHSALKFYIKTQMVYIIVCLAGLFSTQGPIFLVILLLSYASNLYRNSILLRWVDSLISAGLLLFILVNKLYLHLDLVGWTTDFLKSLLGIG